MSTKVKNYNNNSVIILFALMSLIFFYSILFYIFSQILVDTLIGICILVLFYLFYFFLRESIYNYFLSQWNSILFFFFNLLFLISSLKVFILNINYNYLAFLKYKLISLYVSLFTLNFVEIKINLINLFNINFFNLKLLSKLSIIDKFNKYLLNNEILITNDGISIVEDIYHLNLFYKFLING